MTKLGLEAKDLEPTRTIFHSIVPGLSCSSIGWIWLDVLFGNNNHFRHEPILFELVDLSSAYHALLGQPALAKFMAVPQYAYLKMKLPDGAKLAESLVIAKERRQLDWIVALANETSTVPIPAEEPADEASFKPSKETNKVKLNPKDPRCSKYIVVGARLDNK
ncbi:uncharacterized protein [Aegilops tauschii subsp. strangulata]|uniref:uncharacterized protein n=1 Tax=Aegilops tauschii subsp. strangulata TaxID=200361 RepID=UPI00098A1A8C|nr:uncharacterized protein LOC109732225 [Aegilops tauschii subsp. strangulata]